MRTKAKRSQRLKELVLICNEEGKLDNLPTSCVLNSRYYQEKIAGTCFICLADETTGEFEGLPLSLYKHLKEILDESISYIFNDDKGEIFLGIDVDKINEKTEGVVYE